MEIPQKLISYLNDKKIGFEILHHSEAFTAQTVAATEHIKGRHHAKVVLVKAGDEHLMTVLSANSRIDLEKLEETLGTAPPLSTVTSKRVASARASASDRVRCPSPTECWQ